MAADVRQPDQSQLLNHLAFEVHYLVVAAVRFRDAHGTDKVAFQDSAMLHARNLLEFTKCAGSRHGWWIGDLGGTAPPRTTTHTEWQDLINAKVTHLGEGRLRNPSWPVRLDDDRCLAMARFVLNRIVDASKGSTDPRMVDSLTVATLGLDYLDHPVAGRLRSLAATVG